MNRCGGLVAWYKSKGETDGQQNAVLTDVSGFGRLMGVSNGVALQEDRAGGANKVVKYIYGNCPGADPNKICQSAIFPNVITGHTFTICATQRFMDDFSVKRQLLTGTLEDATIYHGVEQITVGGRIFLSVQSFEVRD